MLLAITLLLVGFAILIKGADFLVSGSSSVAKKFNISNIAIGLTVVAFGTSTPELLVSVTSSLKGYNSAAFGNVIGSNNFNLLFILGVAGLIYPLVVLRNTIKYEVPLSLLAAVVLYILVNDVVIWGSATNELSRLDSFILLGFFIVFMLYIYRTMTNATDLDQGDSIKIYSTPVSAGLIVLGIGLLVGGGTLVVDNAIAIAQHYGLSDKLIGLTILAAGTSLPELATSAVAAYKKNTDIAIGNVIGSNIFNIFFILAITGLIRPLPFDIAMDFDLYVLGASTIILMIFMFTLNTRKLDRWEAFLLLSGYIAYTIFLVGME
ncbi:MAG TPA: calcium/sodium antiporter [Cyclobacteriaceae bacterium]|nr:calcium/sodium antiporter [Cyclobacteriaceae bacterium]